MHTQSPAHESDAWAWWRQGGNNESLDLGFGPKAWRIETHPNKGARDFENSPTAAVDAVGVHTAAFWRDLQICVRDCKEVIHPCAKQPLGKAGFSTGAFVVNNQNFLTAFYVLKTHRRFFAGLLSGDPQALELCLLQV